MFSPTALTTPTRLPWWWPLLVGWLLLALWSPAFASDVTSASRTATEPALDAREPYRMGSWQLVGMDTALRTLARGGDAATMPRMLPLAVMPQQHGAWWFGLSGSRSVGARVELRWTLPLDGSAAWRRTGDAD
jgi:hypothetical protein